MSDEMSFSGDESRSATVDQADSEKRRNGGESRVSVSVLGMHVLPSHVSGR